MPNISFQIGERTEDLLQYITHNVNDEILDQIEVERDYAKDTGLANEPLTTSVVLTISVAAISAVTRLIERWMENQREIKGLEIVAKGFSESDEAGRQLKSLEEKYADVSVSFELSRPSWQDEKVE